MNKYESLYIISTTLEEEAIHAEIEKFSGHVTANGGTVSKIDEWGKKRLAYAIEDRTEGYYVLMNFESDSELPKELTRNFKNDENILRYIVVCREG